MTITLQQPPGNCSGGCVATHTALRERRRDIWSTTWSAGMIELFAGYRNECKLIFPLERDMVTVVVLHVPTNGRCTMEVTQVRPRLTPSAVP